MPTKWNHTHPQVMMNDHGQGIKEHLRKMSNAELNQTIRENSDDPELLLALPRNKKIALIVYSCKRDFVEHYKKQQEEAERASKNDDE